MLAREEEDAGMEEVVVRTSTRQLGDDRDGMEQISFARRQRGYTARKISTGLGTLCPSSIARSIDS